MSFWINVSSLFSNAPLMLSEVLIIYIPFCPDSSWLLSNSVFVFSEGLTKYKPDVLGDEVLVGVKSKGGVWGLEADVLDNEKRVDDIIFLPHVSRILAILFVSLV